MALQKTIQVIWNGERVVKKPFDLLLPPPLPHLPLPPSFAPPLILFSWWRAKILGGAIWNGSYFPRWIHLIYSFLANFICRLLIALLSRGFHASLHCRFKGSWERGAPSIDSSWSAILQNFTPSALISGDAIRILPRPCDASPLFPSFPHSQNRRFPAYLIWIAVATRASANEERNSKQQWTNRNINKTHSLSLSLSLSLFVCMSAFLPIALLTNSWCLRSETLFHFKSRYGRWINHSWKLVMQLVSVMFVISFV